MSHQMTFDSLSLINYDEKRNINTQILGIVLVDNQSSTSIINNQMVFNQLSLINYE
jgi:hypothetical protein